MLEAYKKKNQCQIGVKKKKKKKNQHSPLDMAKNCVLYNKQNKGRQRKKKRNELLNPPNVLTTTAKAAYINCEIFSQKATKLVSIERRNDL